MTIFNVLTTDIFWCFNGCGRPTTQKSVFMQCVDINISRIFIFSRPTEMRKMIKVLPSERQVYNSRKFKSIQEHPLIREKIICQRKKTACHLWNYFNMAKYKQLMAWQRRRKANLNFCFVINTVRETSLNDIFPFYAFSALQIQINIYPAFYCPEGRNDQSKAEVTTFCKLFKKRYPTLFKLSVKDDPFKLTTNDLHKWERYHTPFRIITSYCTPMFDDLIQKWRK